MLTCTPVSAQVLFEKDCQTEIFVGKEEKEVVHTALEILQKDVKSVFDARLVPTQARFGVQDDPQRQDQKTGNVEDDPKEQVLFHFLSHSLSAKYKISDAKRLKVVHVCTIRAGFYF